MTDNVRKVARNVRLRSEMSGIRHRGCGSLENEYCLTERAYEAYAHALEAREEWDS